MGVLDLVNFWSQHGEETIDHFKDLLATTSFEGQHLYNIYFYNLADQLPEMFISQDAEAGLTIRLSFHNVSIEAISTQPTLFGSWADPLVRLSFDLTLDVKLNQISQPTDVTNPDGSTVQVDRRIESITANLSESQFEIIGGVTEVLDSLITVSEVGAFALGHPELAGASLAMGELIHLALGDDEIAAKIEDAVNGSSFEVGVDQSMQLLLGSLGNGATLTYDADADRVLFRVPRHGEILPTNLAAAEPYFRVETDVSLQSYLSIAQSSSAVDSLSGDLAFLQQDSYLQDISSVELAATEYATLDVDAATDIAETQQQWVDGYWTDGYWTDGQWQEGYWTDGYWVDGYWTDGYWTDGTGHWVDGYWTDGYWGDVGGASVWTDGYWTDGYWVEDTAGYWTDGYWTDGYWVDGFWTDGYWLEEGYWTDGFWTEGYWIEAPVADANAVAQDTQVDEIG